MIWHLFLVDEEAGTLRVVDSLVDMPDSFDDAQRMLAAKALIHKTSSDRGSGLYHVINADGDIHYIAGWEREILPIWGPKLDPQDIPLPWLFNPILQRERNESEEENRRLAEERDDAVAKLEEVEADFSRRLDKIQEEVGSASSELASVRRSVEGADSTDALSKEAVADKMRERLQELRNALDDFDRQLTEDLDECELSDVVELDTDDIATDLSRIEETLDQLDLSI